MITYARSRNEIISAVKSCLPSQEKSIGLHEPCFAGKEWEYIKDCLDTGWVSSVGKYVDTFEEKLAEYTGVRRAIAVVNGTAALHIALKLVGVEQGDEVLAPAMTFIATTNAITYCGAIPHFVDSEKRTMGIDPYKLADYLSEIAEIRDSCCFNSHTGRRLKAVLPMHTFGHPVDLDPLVDICNRWRLELVEDAAESLGSYYKGRHTGNLGKVAALSFNGNKIVTTGGGGAILTNDEELGRIAKHITTTAKLPHKWAFNHDKVGYNYRLPNINAALGCAQMEQLPAFLANKRALAARYEQAFASVDGIEFFKETEFATSNYWLNAILLNDGFAAERDTILEMLHQNGLLARPAWTLMHKLPMYANNPRADLSTVENLEQRIINLPSSVFL
ncbi:LegC family aminotransferase [Anaeroselena agilis]|uniref:LegC family aminotransferase n=1 Tax=Anaeroselena agilis TaxID=3063788 RepID=A0ABU3P494_9FIRM|nr:LegC family aminotransferase [Selenomonadales bacterium 4137-cl]